DDKDSSGDYTSDDAVLYGTLTDATGVQYWATDSSTVSGVSGLISTLPQSDPAAFFIEEKDSQDQQEAYVVEPAWDGTDSEVEVGGEDVSAAVSFTGTRSRAQLNTDDNVYQSYDSFGTFVQEDTSGTGSVTINYPDQQAVAGAAFTGAAGGLSTGGTSSEQVSVTYTGVTNQDIRGSMPAVAAVDSQVSQQTKQNADLILVGGPAVNTLVADLAAQGDTWTVQEWRNQHQGEALLQLVEDAFSQGNHALIVAGYMADDTARAAEYISDYGQHQAALQGETQYTPSGD
ncbi:MAG: S-layer protein, partial [Candidatus Nanohaloarchaea archaeon]|nr:S-layer protein [Candidatus Nanohaloarchaea archaeon]